MYDHLFFKTMLKQCCIKVRTWMILASKEEGDKKLDPIAQKSPYDNHNSLTKTLSGQ